MIQDELTRLADEADDEDEDEEGDAEEGEKQPSGQGVEAWKYRTLQGKVAYIVLSRDPTLSSSVDVWIVFHNEFDQL